MYRLYNHVHLSIECNNYMTDCIVLVELVFLSTCNKIIFSTRKAINFFEFNPYSDLTFFF